MICQNLRKPPCKAPTLALSGWNIHANLYSCLLMEVEHSPRGECPRHAERRLSTSQRQERQEIALRRGKGNASLSRRNFYTTRKVGCSLSRQRGGGLLGAGSSAWSRVEPVMSGGGQLGRNTRYPTCHLHCDLKEYTVVVICPENGECSKTSTNTHLFG